MCCSPWGCKESDTTERLNWTVGSHVFLFSCMPGSNLFYTSFVNYSLRDLELFFFSLHMLKDWFGSSKKLNHWWIIMVLLQLGFRLFEHYINFALILGFDAYFCDAHAPKSWPLWLPMENLRILSRPPPTKPWTAVAVQLFSLLVTASSWIPWIHYLHTCISGVW